MDRHLWGNIHKDLRRRRSRGEAVQYRIGPRRCFLRMFSESLCLPESLSRQHDVPTLTWMHSPCSRCEGF